MRTDSFRRDSLGRTSKAVSHWSRFAVAFRAFCAVFVLTTLTVPSLADDSNTDNKPKLDTANNEGVNPKTIPIGLSNFLIQLDAEDEIGLASGSVKVQILQYLRNLGFDAVGAENLVFDHDESQRALARLGGTIKKLDCKKEYSRMSCRMSLEWQLLDVRQNTIVYTVTTRVVVRGLPLTDKSKMPSKLMRASIDSLIEKANFLKSLSQLSEKNGPEQTYAPAVFGKCNSLEKTMPSVSEEVLNATAIVRSPKGAGSGFFISSDGLLLTAAHVLDGGKATIVLRNGREFEGTVIRVVKSADAALIRMAQPLVAQPCLALLQDEKYVVGGELYALGAPTDGKNGFTVTKGILSGVRDVEKNKIVQTDAPINPGNSGGPLVDNHGTSIAVISSKLVGRSVEGVGFGVSIISVLKSLAITPGKATDSALLSAPALAPLSRVVRKIDDEGDPIPSLDEEKPSRSNNSSVLRDPPAPVNMDTGLPFRSKLFAGGIGTMAGGVTAIVATKLLYDKDNVSHAEYNRLVVVNSIGWGVALVGAGMIGVSYVIAPDKAITTSTPTTSILAGPGTIQLTREF